MKIYKTVSGDTFDIIAKKELGDEMHIGSIIETNIDKADILIFEAGVRINIPEVQTRESREKLPPWKR